MNVLVTYMSVTGNTKRVAEAIYDVIQEEKEIKPWEEVESVEGYDLAFVGFPVHRFGPDDEQRAWLETMTKGHRIALFVTHAMPPGAPLLQQQLDTCQEPVAAADLAGFFNCQGEMSSELAEMLMQADNPEFRSFGEMRPATLGHPTADEIEQAREFARGVIEKVSAG